MTAQHQRPLAHPPPILGQHAVIGFPANLLFEVDQHAIVKHRHPRGAGQAVAIPFRRGEDDVERLPLTGRAAGIDARWRLAIDRSILTVGIELFGVGIEDLDFVKAHEQHAIVAAVIPWTLEIRRGEPFEVQLHVSKRFPAGQVPGPSLDHPVHHPPRIRLPSRKILTREKHRCVRWHRRGGWCRSGIDPRRRRPIRIMHVEPAPGEDRCVFVTVDTGAIASVDQVGAERDALELDKGNGREQGKPRIT